ncbi:MAG: hypothetical protein GTN78_11755 [Gemmatimonadales bacterium]|nr:hypothetical protein [Gemmatimonadales bacterium]NIR00857.1 hypothetical protein [Gemmatimonadales bacterium]
MVGTGVLRWIIVGWGAVFGLAVIYLHLVSPGTLGSGRRRVKYLLVGVLAVMTATGAAVRIPSGWYAALAFSAFNVADSIVSAAPRRLHVSPGLPVGWGAVPPPPYLGHTCPSGVDSQCRGNSP